MIVAASRKPKYENICDAPQVKAQIRRVVDEAPPLSPRQVALLRSLFAAAQANVQREATGATVLVAGFHETSSCRADGIE